MLLWVGAVLVAQPPSASAPTSFAQPLAPLPMARQIAVRESWLPRRYDVLLRIMRARKIGMWLVVNEEFHDDPLTALIAPPRPYVGRRDIFVFADAGDAGLARVAITGYAEENVQRYFESPSEPAAQGKALAGLVAKYSPASIALAVGGSRGVTRSLTHDAYQFILESIGPEAAAARVKAADAKKASEEAALIRLKWPAARPSPDGALVRVMRKGRGEPAAAGHTLTVLYTGRLLDGRLIASSEDDGRPVPGSAARPFTYVVGTSRLNPALDEALGSMRAGERRLVIAQGQAGYGRGGYTSPQKPGEKRFVISPNTTFVYEIEVAAIAR